MAPVLVLDTTELNINKETVDSNLFSLSGRCGIGDEDVVVAIGDLLELATPCTILGTWSLNSINVQRLDDGQGIALVIKQQDSSNNMARVEETLDKDIEVPVVTVTSPSLTINGSNQHSYQLEGTCSEQGRGVRVAIGDTSAGDVLCLSDLTWVLAVDGTLGEGSYSLAVSQEDALANRGVLTPSPVLIKDVQVPVVTVTSPLVINFDNQNSYQLAGTCSEHGRSVSIALGSLVPQTAVCDGNGQWALAPATTLEDNSYALAITQADAAGNQGALATAATLLKDVTTPVFAFDANLNITSDNQDDYQLSGSCQEDGTITATVADWPSIESIFCRDGTWSSATIAVSSLAEGTYTVSATMEDLAGNSSETVTASITKEAEPLSIAIDDPAPINLANRSSYPVSGTCGGVENGAPVVVFVSNKPPSNYPLCSNGTWSTRINVKNVADRARVFVYARLSFGGQNVSQWLYVIKDTIAPTLGMGQLSAITSDNQSAYDLAGTCSENGQNVQVGIGGVKTEAACTNGAWSIGDYNFTVAGLIGNSITVTANLNDIADNPASEVSQLVPINMVAPVVTLSTTELVINKEEAEGNLFSLAGTCSEGDGDVMVAIGGLSELTAPCSSSGEWNLDSIDTRELGDGQGITLVLRQVDSSNNEGRAESTLDKDIVEPVVTVTSPSLVVNSGNQARYQLIGTCSETGGQVSITLGSLAPATAPCSDDGQWAFAVPTSLGDGEYALAVAQRDAAGNEGGLASAATLLKDVTIPTLAFNINLGINSANEASYRVSGTCQEDGTVTVTVASFPDIEDILCRSGVWRSNDMIVSSLAEGTYIISATMEDSAGNVSETITATVLKNTLTEAVAINLPTPINKANQLAYPVSGICSNYVGDVTVTVGGQSPAVAPSCNQGLWQTEVDVSGAADSSQVAMAASFNSDGSEFTASETVLKDVVPPTMTINQRGSISGVSGTCSEAGQGVTVSLGDDSSALHQVICSPEGTWTVATLNTGGVAEGVFTFAYSHSDVVGNTTDWTIAMHKSSSAVRAQSFELPYLILKYQSYRTIQPGGLPFNYIGELSVLEHTAGRAMSFEIDSIVPEDPPGGPYSEVEMSRMGEEWKDFFDLDSSTGELSLTNNNTNLNSLFEFPSGHELTFYYLSHIHISYQKENLPIPETFVLNINVSQEGESEKTKMAVKAHLPAFGAENCDILDWNADWGSGDDAWTAEEVAEMRKKSCKHLDYGIEPKGIEFVTTQNDIDRLPDGLSQTKENYQIIFRDEFSQPGGYKKLDPRLWRIYVGKPCHQFESIDGALHIKASTTCLSKAGKIVSPTIKSQLEYRYGYAEARFHRLPVGNADGSGHFMWASYHVRGHYWALRKHQKIGEGKDFFNFVCRGNNLYRKRQRWLATLGVEMQHLELYSSSSTISKAWWVYHTMQPGIADHCYDTPNIPDIYSGLYWELFRFDNASFANGKTFTLGVEWTPSGYRGFLNGVPYSGNTDPNYTYIPNVFREYGFSVPGTSSIYGYASTAIPQSGLIDRTVSHLHQGFAFRVGPSGGKGNMDPANVDENWQA